MRRTRTILSVALLVTLATVAMGATVGAAVADVDSTSDDAEASEYAVDGALFAEETADGNGTDGNETGDTETSDNETDPIDTIGDYNVTQYSTFGQAISAFINETAKNETERPFGHLVATFATMHNPGSPPAHAGPPIDGAGPAAHAEDNETGPPAHAGPAENETGPPEHAGQNGNETGQAADAGPPKNGTGPPDDNGGAGGPPEHAGGGDGGPPEKAGPKH